MTSEYLVFQSIVQKREYEKIDSAFSFVPLWKSHTERQKHRLRVYGNGSKINIFTSGGTSSRTAEQRIIKSFIIFTPHQILL